MEEVKIETNGMPDGGQASGSEQIGNDSTGITDLKIPENWDSGVREYLGSLTDIKGKTAFYNRVKELEDKHNQKLSSFAEERKAYEAEKAKWQSSRAEVEQWDEFVKALTPAQRESMAANGNGSFSGYMRYLSELDAMASTNPDEFITRLLKGYGITADNAAEKIAALFTGNAGMNVDFESRIADVERKAEERVQREFAEREAKQMYNDFINAKDEKGNPAHPHFEQLKGEMATLLKAYPDITLKELYQKAILFHPELTQVQEVKADAIKEKAEKKSLAAGLTGKSMEAPKTAPLS